MTITPASPALEFHNNLTVAVQAGSYRITVEQKITDPGGKVTEPSPTRVEREFSVTAPRFAIDPSFIESVYPGPASTGAFGLTLPHVVIARSVLPWEVGLEGVAGPWLALVVFATSEVIATTRQTVKALADSGSADHLVPRGLPTEGPDSAIVCQSVTTTLADFRRVAPAKEDLPFLAHVRTVNTADQPRRQAVLVANRFPYSSSTDPVSYVACVVSLRGLEKHLDDTSEPGTRTVSLLCLHSWEFTSRQDGKASFPGVMSGLTKDRQGDQRLLRLTENSEVKRDITSPVLAEVRARLAAGYTALTHWLPSGKKTFAWYRGPLAPGAAVSPLDITTERILAAAQALIYVQAYGVLDVRYATAWNLGRALALADTRFCRTLLRWRHHRHLKDQAALAENGAPPTRADRESASDKPGEDEQVVRDWIRGLKHLAGVPFCYVVPDRRMLSAESLRFATVDTGWVVALTHGALSVGVTRSYDVDEIDPEITKLAASAIPATGMIMRSVLAADYPDLEVRASTGNTAIEVATRALASDVRMWLFAQKPTKVVIAEPHKGMCFGVDPPSGTNSVQPGTSVLNLRYLTTTGEHKVGDEMHKTFPEGGLAPSYLRLDGQALRAAKLATELKNQIASATVLSSSQFALQMINLPYRQEFESGRMTHGQ